MLFRSKPENWAALGEEDKLDVRFDFEAARQKAKPGLEAELTLDVFRHRYDALQRDIAALTQVMNDAKPDVVVVISTVWDVLDRQLVAGGPTLSPTDPDLEAAMKYSLAAFTDSLLALGVPRVVWLREPVPLPTPTADRKSTRLNSSHT